MDLMEARMIKLELAVEKILERLFAVERDLAVIRSNYTTKDQLAEVQRDVAVIRSNYVTKEDLAALEVRLIKWFIGTAVTLAGIVFAAGKWIH